MFKKLKIQNFRCFSNFEIDFENDLTLIVGENDSGKTTIVDAIKLITDEKKPDPEDFRYGENKITMELHIDDCQYIFEYELLQDNQINKEVFLILSHSKLNEFKNIVLTFDEKNEEGMKDLHTLARLFNITVRNNSRLETIKQNIIRTIDEYINHPEYAKISTQFPQKVVYILDGKHMEDISSFVNEMFFKEKRNSIWNETIDETTTIKQFIQNTLNSYASEVERIFDEEGIRDKIREFLPELSDIKVEPEFTPKDLAINPKVKILQGDSEILISKKGDGTKRRITLALLDISNKNKEEKGIYIFDEVDTHLHVRAQNELMHKLKNICENGSQVIITSHSPFILNSVQSRQIRALKAVNNSTSLIKINYIENIDMLLRNLGIENIYLFFGRKILLVEGETEERFISLIFEKLFHTSLYSNLIKVVNVEGINNIPGFVRAMLALNERKNNIYVLCDNDINEDTAKLIKDLGISEQNVCRIGHKEFEDSFDSEVIYNAWKHYIESKDGEIGPNWTIENIQRLKEQCLSDGKKFSTRLSELNKKCSESLKKQKLAIALAEYCTEEHIDKSLLDLLRRIYLAH